MKFYTILILLISTTFSLLSMDLNLDGEIKNRTEDLDVEMRVRLGMDLDFSSPIYTKTQIEVGYLDINSELTPMDLTDLEVKKLFLGYENNWLDSKLGIVPLKTPNEYIFSDNSLGIKLDIDLGKNEIKTFYSAVNLLSNNLEPIDMVEDLDHIFFLGYENKSFIDLELWLTYYEENEFYDQSSWEIWGGSSLGTALDDFDIGFNYIYYTGMILETRELLSAWYTTLNLEYDLTKQITISSMFSLNGGESDFTSADNKGEYSSDLKILLEDTLITNSFTFESGINIEFDLLDLETKLTAGGVVEDSDFSGLEIDFNSKMELIKNLELEFNLAYLLPDTFQISTELCYSL